MISFLSISGCSDDDSSGGSGGIQLLSNLSLSGQLTDVWGYVDTRTGKEYANRRFGAFTDGPQSGIYIVDVSAPQKSATSRNDSFDIVIANAKVRD